MSEVRVARRTEDLLRLGERVLGLAEAAGASEAEILLSADDSALTRFANSEIHQNVAESNVQLNLRFVSRTTGRGGVDGTNRRGGPADAGRADGDDRAERRRAR